MTVEQLMDALEAFPGSMEVYYSDRENGHTEIVTVKSEQFQYHGPVVVELTNLG